MRMVASFHIPGSALFRYFFAVYDSRVWTPRLLGVGRMPTSLAEASIVDWCFLWKNGKVVMPAREAIKWHSELEKFDLSAVDRAYIKRHKIRETNAPERSKGVRPMGVLRIQGEWRGEAVCTYARNAELERHQLGNISIFRYRINGSLPRARRAHKSFQAYHASESKPHGLMGCVRCPHVLLYSLGFLLVRLPAFFWWSCSQIEDFLDGCQFLFCDLVGGSWKWRSTKKW